MKTPSLKKIRNIFVLAFGPLLFVSTVISTVLAALAIISRELATIGMIATVIFAFTISVAARKGRLKIKDLEDNKITIKRIEWGGYLSMVSIFALFFGSYYYNPVQSIPTPEKQPTTSNIPDSLSLTISDFEGRPVPKLEIGIKGTNVSGRTNERGFLRLNIPESLRNTANVSLHVIGGANTVDDWVLDENIVTLSGTHKITALTRGDIAILITRSETRRRIEKEIESNLPILFPDQVHGLRSHMSSVSEYRFAAKENLIAIKEKHGKEFISGIKSNRLVALSLDDKKQGNFQRIDSLEFKEGITYKVYLKGLFSR